MNCFFYQTKTQYSNTGDALINGALIRTLREYGRVFVNCSLDTPTHFLTDLGINEGEEVQCKNNSEFALKIISYAKKHRNDNVYIVSGLGDIYGGGLKKVSRNLLSSCILPIYNLLGVENIRIGRSFGTLTKSMQISEWLRSLFVKYYFVRDTQSLQRCKEMHINKAKICPDMSWLYDSKAERRENNSNCVMINMKCSTLNIKEQKYMDAIITQCKCFLNELKHHTKSPVQVLVAFQVQEDAEFSQYIYSALKEDYTVSIIERQMSISELRKYYSLCSYHLSNRMHSLLSGYKYGSLPIAIIDTKMHHKIKSTFDDCELQELVIDVYDNNSLKRMDNIIYNKSELYHKVILCETKCAKEVRINLDNILKK